MIFYAKRVFLSIQYCKTWGLEGAVHGTLYRNWISCIQSQLDRAKVTTPSEDQYIKLSSLRNRQAIPSLIRKLLNNNTRLHKQNSCGLSLPLNKERKKRMNNSHQLQQICITNIDLHIHIIQISVCCLLNNALFIVWSRQQHLMCLFWFHCRHEELWQQNKWSD